jgi:hypothetical protein
MIKKEQGRLVLEFCKSRRNAKHLGGHRGITPFTEREITIMNEVKILNHRGVQPLFAV